MSRVTDEQARAAAERLRRWDSGESPSSIYGPGDEPNVLTPIELANNDAWDLARRCMAEHRAPPDDGPITAEQADRAYDEAKAVPIPDEEIESLLQHVRDRSDGPITAEWCREHGAMIGHDVVRKGQRHWSVCWAVANVAVSVCGGTHVFINGHEVARQLTRSELLAIVTALKGSAS